MPDSADKAGADPSDLDQAFTILASSRRRLVVRYLMAVPESSAHLEDIAEHVATSPAEPHDVDVIKTNLHHRDLPMLAAAGVIGYDTEQKTVRYHQSQLLEGIIRTIGTTLEAS